MTEMMTEMSFELALVVALIVTFGLAWVGMKIDDWWQERRRRQGKTKGYRMP